MNIRKLGAAFAAACLLTLFVSLTVSAAGTWKTVDDNKYYYDENGKMQTGWISIDEKTYYFSPKTGAMMTGLRKISGVTYLFGDDGVLQETYPKACWKKTSSGKIWYSYGDGTRPKKQWLAISGKTYYFDKNGYVKTGWSKVKKETYYFNKKGVLQVNKWKTYKGSKVYLSADGSLAKDTWVDDKYLDENGFYIEGFVDERRTSKTDTGWVGYDKTWKYYQNGKLVTGWKKIDGHRYYFDEDGTMHTGWLKVNGHKYFMDTRSVALGQMITGWCRISNQYYYFFKTKTTANDQTFPKGSMAKNLSIRFTLSSGEKKIYVFNAKGVCTNY